MRTHQQLIDDTKPFPNAIIEQLPGRGGGPPMDYVPWHQYNQRLLLQHGAHKYEVTNVTKAVESTKQFQAVDDDGNAEVDASGLPLIITRYKYVWSVSVRIWLDDDEFYDGVGEDNAPNSAESNAYKRACAHAGIGLHLYDKDGFWLHGKLLRDDDE